MREIPILMRTDLVKQVLADRKSETRRLPNSQPGEGWTQVELGSFLFCDHSHLRLEHTCQGDQRIKHRYGQPGDVLWVKENHWRFGRWVKVGAPTVRVSPRTGKRRLFQKWKFKARKDADGVFYFDDVPPPPDGRAKKRGQLAWHHRPSIYMPRAACRLRVEIAGLRLERLQDITEAGALAEGVAVDRGNSFHVLGYEGQWAHATARGCFETLFGAIHGGGIWESNPWVVVITFKRKTA